MYIKLFQKDTILNIYNDFDVGRCHSSSYRTVPKFAAVRQKLTNYVQSKARIRIKIFNVKPEIKSGTLILVLLNGFIGLTRVEIV